MSIAADFRIKLLPFRQGGGALPLGLWTGQGSVANDASGGEAFVGFQVVTLTEPFSALVINIEQVELTDDGGANVTVLLEATGFEEHDPDANRNVIFKFSTITGPTSATGVSAQNMLVKPIFLGRCDRTSGQDSRIRLIWANVNGIRTRAALFGYYWGPEAMNVAGGPIRPLGSVFGG